MNIALVFFFVVAATGFVLSVTAHLAALFGLPQPLGDAVMGLHIGIFVVWLPAVMVGNQLVKDFQQKDFWKAALRGCPPWMRGLTFAVFVYAVLNFFMFIALAPARVKGQKADTRSDVRGFSGHWMAFYAAGASLLYSGLRVRRKDMARRCSKGHPVSASASFCEACGAELEPYC
jgi:hypothetical protein